jgi:putative flippase GtrA
VTGGWLGRGGIIRSALSSGVATLSDFALVAFLFEVAGAPAPVATFVGCLAGGLINFTISRVWAFHSSVPRGRSLLRYGGVTAGSAFLNAGLVAVLLLLPRMPYQLAWLAARLLVFVGWNYPLHRGYVFASRKVTPRDAPST